MGNDQLKFTISWQGGSKALVHHIIDNDEVVVTGRDTEEGYSPITCSYSTAAAAIHAIEWSLWFPGSSAKQLVARVSINGGPPVTLGSEDGETKNKWASRGAAP